MVPSSGSEGDIFTESVYFCILNILSSLGPVPLHHSVPRFLRRWPGDLPGMFWPCREQSAQHRGGSMASDGHRESMSWASPSRPLCLPALPTRLPLGACEAPPDLSLTLPHNGYTLTDLCLSFLFVSWLNVQLLQKLFTNPCIKCIQLRTAVQVIVFDKELS